MEPLLENTQLRTRPYKKHETYKVLVSLLNPGMQRKVNSTTKRIVKRIIEDWWEKLCDGGGYYIDNVNSPNLSHTSILSCTTSTSSSDGPTTPTTEGVDEIASIIPRKDVEKKKLLEQENNINNHSNIHVV
jgi:hypothetical protein